MGLPQLLSTGVPSVQASLLCLCTPYCEQQEDDHPGCWLDASASRRHAPTFGGHSAFSFFVARAATPAGTAVRSGQAAPRRDYCKTLATVDSLRYSLRASLSSPPYS